MFLLQVGVHCGSSIVFDCQSNKLQTWGIGLISHWACAGWSFWFQSWSNPKCQRFTHGFFACGRMHVWLSHACKHGRSCGNNGWGRIGKHWIQFLEVLGVGQMARCPSFGFDPCHSIQDIGILPHVHCWSRGRFGCFESIVCGESVGVSVVFDRQEPSVLWSHFCELSAIVVVVMLCVVLGPTGFFVFGFVFVLVLAWHAGQVFFVLFCMFCLFVVCCAHVFV